MSRGLVTWRPPVHAGPRECETPRLLRARHLNPTVKCICLLAKTKGYHDTAYRTLRIIAPRFFKQETSQPRRHNLW